MDVLPQIDASAEGPTDQNPLNSSIPWMETSEKQAVSSTSGARASFSASQIASSYFPLGTAAASHQLKIGNATGEKRNSRQNPLRLESTTGSDHLNINKKSSEPSRNLPSDPAVASKPAGFSQNLSDPTFFQDRTGPNSWNPYAALPGLYPNHTFSPTFHPLHPYDENAPKINWNHMYAGEGRLKHPSTSGEFDHKYEFRTLLAKQADEKSKKHVQSLGRTIRSIVRMIGTFETTFVTVRGCFYGLLCAIEYGTLGWQMLVKIPAVRMAFDVFRWFWKYVRFVGRNGPLVGLFALICTYVGRTCLPVIRNAVLLYRSNGARAMPSTTRRVKFSYFAKTTGELSVTLGEEVSVEGEDSGEEMVLVRRVKSLPGRPTSGFVPKSVLFKNFQNSPTTES